MKLIRISKAAKILGVSAAAVRNWTKRGLINTEFVSPSGQRFYDEEKIRAIAKEGRLIAPKSEEPGDDEMRFAA